MTTATQVCRVPLAHIHRGETTEDAIDEAFRMPMFLSMTCGIYYCGT